VAWAKTARVDGTGGQHAETPAAQPWLARRGVALLWWSVACGQPSSPGCARER